MFTQHYIDVAKLSLNIQTIPEFVSHSQSKSRYKLNAKQIDLNIANDKVGESCAYITLTLNEL